MSGKPSSIFKKKKQIHNYPTPKTKTPNTTQNNARYNPQNTRNNRKWATFTFISPHIRKINNLFKHTNVKIAFRYTVARLTKPPNVHKIPPHNKWGTYQLTSKPCDLLYVDQTSRSLKIRYQEHIRYIRSNNPQSAYAQHILRNRHEYGTTNNLMSLLKSLNNRNMLTPKEQFYIRTLHKEGKLIPEHCTGNPKPLFELAIHPAHTPHDSQSAKLPHPGHITCCSASNSRQPATKGMYSEVISF